MSGLQISDMTDSLTVFPDGAFVPLIVEANTSGLVTTTNYRYNAGLYLAKYATLAANGGAALIGTSGSITVQAALDAKASLATLAASGGSALIGFIQGGSGAVATTVQTEIRLDGLRPEQFGAVGNGTADDSAAILAAIVRSQATGIPVTFTPGSTYGIGATSWTGLSITLTRDLEIYGNGATLKVLVAASQSAVVGAVFPAIKIDGTASVFGLKIHNLKANHNLIKEPIFAPYRCNHDIQGCYPYNGDIGSGGIGDASIFIYANSCTGKYSNNNSINCPFPYYGGHTNTGFHCYDLEIIGNRGTDFHVAGNDTYRGDPYNGVVHGLVMADNIWSDFFGIGFSGVAAQSTACFNVDIHDNILSGFSGSGFSSDIIGTTTLCVGFNVHDNIINDAVAAAVPISMLQVSQSSITGNRGVNVRLAIVVDTTVGDVIIDGNDFTLGTATPAGIGISLIGQVGTTTKISVIGNRMKDFAANYYVGGGGNAVSKIDVIGNTSDGGAKGLVINDTVTGIWVDANNFAGSHGTADIDNTSTNGQLGVQFGQNKFATANGVAQVLFVAAPAPTAKNADATLTIAELLTGIITTTNSAAVALTLPTGTLTAGGTGTMAIGQAFEWKHINLGSASGAMTLTAGVDHTIVGNPVVAISTSARFETRKTAATVFVSYRVA